MSNAYKATISPVKIPKEIKEAITKKIKKKKKDFPRYSEADLVRSAIVNALKKDGFLVKDKDYL